MSDVGDDADGGSGEPVEEAGGWRWAEEPDGRDVIVGHPTAPAAAPALRTAGAPDSDIGRWLDDIARAAGWRLTREVSPTPAADGPEPTDPVIGKATGVNAALVAVCPAAPGDQLRSPRPARLDVRRRGRLVSRPDGARRPATGQGPWGPGQ